MYIRSARVVGVARMVSRSVQNRSQTCSFLQHALDAAPPAVLATEAAAALPLMKLEPISSALPTSEIDMAWSRMSRRRSALGECIGIASAQFDVRECILACTCVMICNCQMIMRFSVHAKGAPCTSVCSCIVAAAMYGATVLAVMSPRPTLASVNLRTERSRQ